MSLFIFHNTILSRTLFHCYHPMHSSHPFTSVHFKFCTLPYLSLYLRVTWEQ